MQYWSLFKCDTYIHIGIIKTILWQVEDPWRVSTLLFAFLPFYWLLTLFFFELHFAIQEEMTSLLFSIFVTSSVAIMFVEITSIRVKRCTIDNSQWTVTGINFLCLYSYFIEYFQIFVLIIISPKTNCYPSDISEVQSKPHNDKLQPLSRHRDNLRNHTFHDTATALWIRPSKWLSLILRFAEITTIRGFASKFSAGFLKQSLKFSGFEISSFFFFFSGKIKKNNNNKKENK